MKAKLLAGTIAFAPADPVPPADKPGVPERKKPATIPTIGTMPKSSTPAQRREFQKMKRDMKRAARNFRYDQGLQEREARDKP